MRFNSDELAQTGDINFASFERLSVALGDRVEEEPSDILRAMKFDAVPGVFDQQIWKWRQSGGEAMVEFLTPAFGDEGVKPLPALGGQRTGIALPQFPDSRTDPRAGALSVGRFGSDPATRAVRNP